MPASPFESEIYRDLLHDDEVGELFSDVAEIRAMMRVEGAVAKAQGELGLIPADSAAVIYRAATDLHLEPASLSMGTGQAGVPVPALVAAFRTAMGSPEHAQYLHWGATSQDIMDTGLILRLAGVCQLVEHRVTKLLQSLARQADTHAELPMAARTRAQIATPTSLGAMVAAWGAPLLDHREVLDQLKPRLLRVSLAGASGNSTALGDRAGELRTALADELELGDSPLSWHSNRSALAEFASLLTRIGGSLAKMGEDHILASQSRSWRAWHQEGWRFVNHAAEKQPGGRRDPGQPVPCQCRDGRPDDPGHAASAAARRCGVVAGRARAAADLHGDGKGADAGARTGSRVCGPMPQ